MRFFSLKNFTWEMNSDDAVKNWIHKDDRINRDSQITDAEEQHSNQKTDQSSNVSTPSSPTLRNDDNQGHFPNTPLMENFIPLAPSSPAMSSTDSMFNLTPYSSHPNDNDDLVLYSDSEMGSQNSLDLSPNNKSEERDSSPSRPSSMRKSKGSGSMSGSISGSGSRSRRSSPKRDTHDSTPSPKPRRRIRRKSNKSDSSEKSHPIAPGYASAPATGKIYRNLLILEESLRQQVIQQKALRTKYLTFMAILCSLIVSLSHYLYFSEVEISSGVRVVLTFVLLALAVTLFLYYLSGEYQKTIVMPRKFLSSTNKGLRQLNVRLVKIKIPVTDRMSDFIRECSLYVINLCVIVLHKFDPTAEHNKNSKIEMFLVSCQSQCQPRIGIADVKLVLNARVFSTDVREGWELYRSEFWIREGVRRRNGLLSFVTGGEDILDKEKLLKRDKRERKVRKRSNTATTPVDKLNDQNLDILATKLDDANGSTPSLLST